MKKLVILFLVTISSVTVLANKNAFHTDLSMGARMGEMNTASGIYTPSSSDLSLGIGVRYMMFKHARESFLSALGFKADFHYDQASVEGAGDFETTTDLLRLTGHLYIDVDELYEFDSRNFGMLLHGGAGLSYMTNDDNKDIGTDKMYNLVFGITPQYRIHQNINLNLDISFVSLGEQDRGVEMVEYLSDRKTTDNYINTTLGVSFGF